LPAARSPSGEAFSVAIVGAGIGGLTAARTLLDLGHEVRVYEQARAFAPVGAGIQLTANAVKALRPFGLEAPLRAGSFVAEAAYNRDHLGNVTNILEMGAKLEARYGAPDLMMHRRLLHGALAGLVPPERVHLGKKLIGLERKGSAVELSFADGARVRPDVVIGADGIHSLVREVLFGAERPSYTGRVAYRTTYPTARLNGLAIDPRAKWWGPDRHVVHYYTTAARDEIYFIAVTPEPDFTDESWSTVGEREMLLAAFRDFHPQVRAILGAAPELRKWALVEREPMPSWSEGRVVLLGDACHPMAPAMAQGAASAMEDAIVLARCLRGVRLAEVEAAFRSYEASRKARTSRLQLTNRQNNWLRVKTDTDWVYDYDPWSAELAATDRG
jgi:salicylate hydroxylase/6-hydroxynicotinate 3-monooxygenase